MINSPDSIGGKRGEGDAITRGGGCGGVGGRGIDRVEIKEKEGMRIRWRDRWSEVTYSATW